MEAGSVIAHSDNKFVYAVNAAGNIVPLPDTRLTAEQAERILGKGWRRCEAIGAKEIEKISARLSRQMWEEKKRRKVLQKMREMKFLELKAAEAKLRAAMCFSANDRLINLQMAAKWKNKQDELTNLIFSEFDPTNRHTALDVELREQPLNPHRFGQKRQGIAT